MGGVDLAVTTKLTKMTKQTITEMLRTMGYANCEIVIRQNITDDQLIDVVKGNRVYIKGITVINKKDMNPEKAEKIKKKLKADITISAEKKDLKDLKELIFNKLELMRIYLKEIGKEPDMVEPLIVKKGATVQTVCEKLHRDFINKFKHAKVWGSSKFPGQIFKLKKELKDKDIIEIYLN